MAQEQNSDDENTGSGEKSFQSGNNDSDGKQSADDSNQSSNNQSSNDNEESQNDGIEERARAMGWVPEENFRGDKSRWVSAENFVKRGDNELPIMRERNRAMEKRLIALEKTLKKFSKHHEDVSEREYKKALADIKSQKADAVERGDKKAFIDAEQMEDDLKETKTQETKTEEKNDGGVHPEFAPWLAENTWYSTDKAAGAFANVIAEELAVSNPELQGKAFFNAIKEAVKTEFPAKFQNQRRRENNSVEGDGHQSNQNNGGGGGKKYSDLPKEAKEACDDFVNQKLMTKEQYLKEYDWS